MFQDIQPHHFHNEYTPRPPKKGDRLLLFSKGKALIEYEAEGAAALPRWESLAKRVKKAGWTVRYLFSVDDTAFFLVLGEMEECKTLHWRPEASVRGMRPDWLAFASATAFHLAKWYDVHRFCGRCAAALEHLEGERALRCPACGAVEYPKIAPVVIVGITDGDKLLLTRYSAPGGYRRHALVAGFVEIGETPEDAVRREVMEEVGLEAANLRYYKSQPWAFSESLLLGFYADADSAAPIRLDETELSEAEWFKRADIPAEDSTMSLTWDMIETFRLGKAP